MLKTQQKKLLLVRNKVVLSSLRRDCAEPISASKPHDLKSKLFTSISSNEADPGRFGSLHHFLCALSYSDPVLEVENAISRELPRSRCARWH